MHVTVLRWPEDRDAIRALAENDTPCLVLVSEDAPPPLLAGCLIDWVRMPAAPTDIRARTEALELRAREHVAAPALTDEGQLVHNGRGVFLSPFEELIARPLVDAFGSAVSERILRNAAWPDGGGTVERVRLHVTRLRKRIAPLDLGISSMRAFGYYMHARNREH